jgi:hypothetical protein
MWGEVDDLVGALRSERSPIRRKFLVLGVRLTSDAARESCLTLIDSAEDQGTNDDELVNSWADMLKVVAEAYRNPGKASATAQ